MTAKTVPMGKSDSQCENALALWKEKGVLSLVPYLNYLHISILVGTPLLGLYGLATCQHNLLTWAWAVVYYFWTGLGITAGYHRLFAHRAYKARFPLRFALAMLGAGAVEGSIRWWCRDHRAHHRYTDSTRDPYSAKEGFIWAHIGWMFIKQDATKIGKSDISDLNKDPLIRFQHRYYLLVSLFMGFVFPCLVAGLLWGDYRGGFFIAGVGRLVFVHHSTFCVNSLAHFVGSHTYDDRRTPRDSVITAFVTLGEGYHNFHHEFPQDYRNAIRFYQYDPTKWCIRMWQFMGLAYDLKKFSENVIQKGKLNMRMKNLELLRAKLDWGPDVNKLPVWDQATIDKKVAEGQNLIIVNKVVHDLKEFVLDHPGGSAIIKQRLGKDATHAFEGGVYQHSNAAHNMLDTLRVAKIEA
eukprot:TRINITY_DN602_c2_g1_i1.p1 TRINITY_DN602_c2_g1~~TRINITY_DN602_c2_g1_i1.p1  ORF type:complete len:410 (-),score=127.24 TRINITY_DN602_c2_g1_i1:292-1521(-)